ncbi:MAG TPA: iron-containing alcohol dehydrogenase [Anaeromyxobacteraceae bacterium]|nr:iron-containing alcohol dehydrogenase [Anaeromyxobacteraceae bacterium]
MPDIATIRFVAPEILSGNGVRSLVGRSALNLGARHVLLVTDPGVEAAGWASEAAAALAAAGVAYTLFDGVSPNPRAAQVHAGAAAYRACGANAIVVVGGGSPVDCAKGIGIVAANGGSILDYEGVDRIDVAIPPLVCLPTTAGAAADASQFAIITDEEAHAKIAIVSKTLVPDLTLLDPGVLTTKPPALTAATGLDTLCHAVEACASTAASPLTDLLALEAIRTLVVSLPRCMERPDDLGARAAMQQACLYAGLAFSNASLGAVHAMAHALGGLRDLPHGECNAILLPHVAAWNFEAAEAPLRRVGAAMGLGLERLHGAEAAGRLRDGLADLARRVGVTGTLRDAGIRPEELAGLARTALEDPCMATNPRIPSEADLVGIFAAAS